MNKILKCSFSIMITCAISFSLSANVMLDKNDVLKTPLPTPYDGKIYSANDLNNFINKAIKNYKQPILIFGANWCPDCRIFSGTMDIPKIKSYINEHFEVLYIDVKRYEINMSLMEEYGIRSQEGVPRVLVFDNEKNLINNSTTAEWRTARDRSAQEIFNFFQEMNKS